MFLCCAKKAITGIFKNFVSLNLTNTVTHWLKYMRIQKILIYKTNKQVNFQVPFITYFIFRENVKNDQWNFTMTIKLKPEPTQLNA